MQKILLIAVLVSSLNDFIGTRANRAEEASESADQAKNEVLKVNEEVDQAIRARDTGTLGRILSDDLDYTNQMGELITKPQWLSNIRSGKLTTVALRHQVVHIHVFGNTAVLVGLSKTTFVYKGVANNSPRRFTRVYVKQDGAWRLVAQHVSAIEKE
jgi:ketosteroid isomerase-like protein